VTGLGRRAPEDLERALGQKKRGRLASGLSARKKVISQETNDKERT
jgi:hypothetical protein